MSEIHTRAPFLRLKKEAVFDPGEGGDGRRLLPVMMVNGAREAPPPFSRHLPGASRSRLTCHKLRPLPARAPSSGESPRTEESPRSQ